MLETRKVDNNKTRKALFANLRPLNVTDVRYIEPRVNVLLYLAHSLEVNMYDTSRHVWVSYLLMSCCVFLQSIGFYYWRIRLVHSCTWRFIISNSATGIKNFVRPNCGSIGSYIALFLASLLSILFSKRENTDLAPCSTHVFNTMCLYRILV